MPDGLVNEYHAELNDVSINARSGRLVAQLLEDVAILRLGCNQTSAGSHVIDAGVNCLGGIEAGRRIAEICMGGLGSVGLVCNGELPNWPWSVQVATSQPVLACLASQLAGWNLSTGEEGDAYRAMASGPGRALARTEALFDELGYQDSSDTATLVLESDKLPPDDLADSIARDCGVEPEGLTLIVTPTGSLAGGMQIAARVVEVALHKAHELRFPLDRIVDATGVTPIPPPTGNPLTAMGRTNDTILFGGQVHLYITGPDVDAEELARALPSSTSPDYGKPFEQVFTDYDFDFFEIDGNLFSPARVSVTALESGKTFFAGKLDSDLIDRSFGVTPKGL